MTGMPLITYKPTRASPLNRLSNFYACFDRDNIACNKGRLQGLTGSLSTCRWRRQSFPEDLKHRAGIKTRSCS